MYNKIYLKIKRKDWIFSKVKGNLIKTEILTQMRAQDRKVFCPRLGQRNWHRVRRKIFVCFKFNK